MTTENIVSPDAETQNPAPETTSTEVVTPETPAEKEPEVPQESPEARAAKALERRLGKRTADYYREKAERERLSAEVEALRRGNQPEQPQLDEEAIREHARQIARAERIAEQSNAVVMKGREKFKENFDRAVDVVIREAGPLIDAKTALPTGLGQAILESEDPALLLHHLGTNPDVAAELEDLTPTQIARKLARLEVELTAKPKTSAAPKPLAPVKPQATIEGPSDQDDIQTWLKKERERLAKRR